jgi:hypothetical protein
MPWWMWLAIGWIFAAWGAAFLLGAAARVVERRGGSRLDRDQAYVVPGLQGRQKSVPLRRVEAYERQASGPYTARVNEVPG